MPAGRWRLTVRGFFASKGASTKRLKAIATVRAKIRQAKMLNAKMKIVTKRIKSKSTTKLARLISEENIL